MPLLSLLCYLASFVSPMLAQDAPAIEAPSVATAAAESVPAPVVASPATGLSNNDTYTNVDGNTVQRPAYSTDGQVPAGASARCGDGTYSFSENRRGTCSGHGGVSQWLR
jgi:hypothetical protein